MFFIFSSFTLLVCGEKNILPNLINSQEPRPVGAGCFWLLGAGAGATWKKNQEPQPLGKKIRSRSPLKKKSGAGAEAPKKLPAPQPSFFFYQNWYQYNQYIQYNYFKIFKMKFLIYKILNLHLKKKRISRIIVNLPNTKVHKSEQLYYNTNSLSIYLLYN